METLLKIPAKMLGELVLPSFCPRCFWLRLRCRNMPFQKFPGIAMIIDSFTKKIVHSYFEQYLKAPSFFHPLGELTRTVPVPHHTKFFYDDKDTAIRLTGTPDDIFLRSDSSFVIADYKTARLNENQTAILPMYEVQLNGYALIAEQNGYNPVEQLELIYFEPQTALESDISNGQMNEGFRLSFKAKFLEIELNPHQIILPLLKQARTLADLQEPPPSREGCKDCQRVYELGSYLFAK
jgi:hypothetical protein